MATPLTGIMETPPQRSVGQSIGRALGGFSAGMQGNGAQYLQQTQQQDQRLDDKRMRAMAQDAQQVYTLLQSNRLEDAIGLMDERVKYISQLGGDPSDTLAIRQKVVGGDIQGAAQDLGMFLSAAAQNGLIAAPKAPEVVSGGDISPEGQVTMIDPATGAMVARNVPGFRAAEKPPEKVTPYSEAAKLQQDLQNGLISPADYDTEITRIRGTVAQKPAVTDLGKMQQDLSNGNITQEQYSTMLDAAIQEQETTAAAAQAKVGEQENRDSMIMMETQRVAELAAKLLGNESGLAGATGPISSLIPSFKQGTVDFEADMAEMKDLLTMTNLGRMTGVLSETDIKLIANAASGVNDRASEGRMKEKLTEIYNRIIPALIAKGITPPPLPGAGSTGRVDRTAGGQNDIFSQADAVLSGSGL